MNENIEVKIMDNVIYDRTKGTRLLAAGRYDGFNFFILSIRGTHPCCYVELPSDNEYFEDPYDDIPFECHGGLTYSGNHLTLVHDRNDKISRYFIGWDYVHCGDYCGFDEEYGITSGHKWTVEELIQEIKESLDEFVEGVLQHKTLKQLLDEDHIHGDIGIFVENGALSMQVSRRYLEGGWEEVLDSPAIKIDDKAYKIIKEDANSNKIGLFSFSK